jgi:hypothetical protein
MGNIFFKDDPDADAKKAAAKEAKEAAKIAAKAKTTAPVTAPQPIQPTVTSQMVTNMTGVADEKFVEMLKGVIVENNIPGQDYFEFKQTLDAMASLPIDERTKFLTIYTTFQLQGCKKETLLSSIDKYVAIVKNEEANFGAELVNQRSSTVTGKLSQVEEARKELEKLQTKMSELNTFIITTSQEVQNSELQLQMTETKFKNSVEKVIGLLLSDKDKINSYIQ